MERRGAGSSPGVGAGGSAVNSHHRSRSATRSGAANMNRSYHSLDRDGHDREFIPIRETAQPPGNSRFFLLFFVSLSPLCIECRQKRETLGIFTYSMIRLMATVPELSKLSRFVLKKK